MMRSAISAVNGIPEFTRRGTFVVAAGALVDAAGDKQGAAGAGAVDDVDGVVLVIIHFRFSINAIAALAALAHPSHVLNVRSWGSLRLPPCSDVNCFAKTKECGHFGVAALGRATTVVVVARIRRCAPLSGKSALVFNQSAHYPRCFTRRFTSSCLPALNGRASGLPR